MHPDHLPWPLAWTPSTGQVLETDYAVERNRCRLMSTSRIHPSRRGGVSSFLWVAPKQPPWNPWS
jgi:hypothetical protein